MPVAAEEKVGEVIWSRVGDSSVGHTIRFFGGGWEISV